MDTQKTEGWETFEVRPNGFWHRRVLLVCTGVLAAVTAGIGIMFAILGAWPILPFAGLEVVLLLGTVLWVRARSYDLERIVVSEHYIHLTRRRGKRISVNSYAKNWTRVELCKGAVSHEPNRLYLVMQGRGIEIGNHLIESSRRNLYRNIKDRLKDMNFDNADISQHRES